MNKILELREKRAKLWDSAKTLLDSRKTENGYLSAEDTEQYEKLETEVVNLGKEIDRLERQATLDLELSKPTSNAIKNNPNNSDGDEKPGRASNSYKSAFWQNMRKKGSAEVFNALQIGTDSEGGYLVPDEFERTLVQALIDQNIMRTMANVITTSSGDRTIPVVASRGTASWVAEEAAAVDSDDSFTQVVLGANKLVTIMKVSEELLNDSAFNLETYIANEYARRIGTAEEDAFINGNGTGKPTGVLTNSQVGVTTAVNNAITFDEIINLYHSLRIPYRNKAQWLMSDSTAKVIRKLKDNNGQYIWQPSVQVGQPDKLLNNPIKISEYVPAIAATAKIMAFGDFSYYWIADRQGRAFQRLNELYAVNGQVGFRAYQRVDGKLILPEAVKVMQMHV